MYSIDAMKLIMLVFTSCFMVLAIAGCIHEKCTKNLWVNNRLPRSLQVADRPSPPGFPRSVIRVRSRDEHRKENTNMMHVVPNYFPIFIGISMVVTLLVGGFCGAWIAMLREKRLRDKHLDKIYGGVISVKEKAIKSLEEQVEILSKEISELRQRLRAIIVIATEQDGGIDNELALVEVEEK